MSEIISNSFSLKVNNSDTIHEVVSNSFSLKINNVEPESPPTIPPEQIADLNGALEQYLVALKFLREKIQEAHNKNAYDITREYTNAQIKVLSDSITQRVDRVEEKQTSVDGKVSALETWKSSAEQKITADAIINTVSSTITQAKNEAIGEANANTTNALKNYSTTTQMNSAIQQKADSINATVSSNYTDLNGKIQSANTAITQTANKIASKVDSNGVKSIIEQSPDSVKVGFNGITNAIVMSQTGIRMNSNAGAYTQFSSDGMNSYDNSGNMTLGLRNGGMTFHAWNNHEYVGYISQTAVSSTGYNGVSLGMTPNGDYISLGVSSDATNPNSGFKQAGYFVIARHDNHENNTLGLNAYKNLNMHGWDITNGGTFTAGVFYSKNGMKFKGNSPIYFDGDATYPSAIWEDSGDGMVRFYGDNGIIMGYKNGSTNEQCFYIKETKDGLNCRIGMYDHLNMNGWRIKNATVNNCSFRLDEYQRTTADYVSIFKYSNSSKSEMNIELANDYVTWFNIQANNYVDKGKYIACFNYQNGTAASNIGVHFYRAMNCHGYNITNVGNMSVYSVRSEELEVNDIRVSTPFAVMSRSGEQTSLSVTKSIDDLTEANGTVTISNKQAKVELPQGLIFTDYYVQVTGNKIANLAVTERTDEYFMIETDSEEEIEVFYTIKAFQPKYVTRTSVYGELQGEDGTVSATYEEAMAEERARTAQLLSAEEGVKPADLSKPGEPAEIVRDSFHT